VTLLTVVEPNAAKTINASLAVEVTVHVKDAEVAAP
jgi:hypothetical protein